ncbi:MAG: bleomycin resistance protein [Paracoccaceae bacterium]
MTDEHWAGVVPELSCSDLAKSLRFYIDLLGFEIRFERLESGFACIIRERAILMLEQVNDNWTTGSLEHPFGRGLNFQIEVEDAQALHDKIVVAGYPLFRSIKSSWYRQGDLECGQLEFLVQDPDGYLLRFSQHLGRRPLQANGD